MLRAAAPAARSGFQKPDRPRTAGHLKAERRIRVELVVWGSVLDADLGEIDLELLRNQHRKRSIGALSHFDPGRNHRDAPILFDPHERVRGQRLGLRRRDRVRGRQQPEAYQEATAGRRAGGQDGPARKSASRDCDRGRFSNPVRNHDQPPFVFSAVERAACLIA
jgi:hypothetical protein